MKFYYILLNCNDLMIYKIGITYGWINPEPYPETVYSNKPSSLTIITMAEWERIMYFSPLNSTSNPDFPR